MNTNKRGTVDDWLGATILIFMAVFAMTHGPSFVLWLYNQ